MLTWLGGGRAVARVRVPRPRPQLRHQQSPRYQPTAQAFRPNSVQVLDQQRRRLVDERPRVLMPSRLAVPEAPVLGSHLVVPQPPIRSQEDVQPEPKLVHHHNPAPVVSTHRTPLLINRGPPVQQVAPAVQVQVRTPEAPRPHVVRLDQRRRGSRPVVRLDQPPLVRVEQRVEQIAPIVRVEQAPVRVHSTPRFQPSSLQVKPSAEDLTFLISKQITQSIRERIPTILSNLKAKQSKQTKVVQAPVTVTHTVTSTSSSSSSSSSSSTAKKSPSHHYVQNSIIGQEQRKKVEKKKEDKMEKMMEMEEMKKKMEEEEIILPQPAPMLVEDTREHKPVWTVTRQRPRQTTVKPRKTKTQVQPEAKVVKKVCWIGGGRSALTCKQVRRKLVGEEDKKAVKQQQGRRRIQLKQVKEAGSKRAEMNEKSRMLLHPEPQDANNDSDPEEISLQLANRMMEEEELSSE